MSSLHWGCAWLELLKSCRCFVMALAVEQPFEAAVFPL